MKDLKNTKKAIGEFVKKMLSENGEWAKRALVRIYERQTSEEQLKETTVTENGVGFNGNDAEILTSFAKQYLKRGFLSEKQMIVLKKKISKYWKQIIEVSGGYKKIDDYIEKHK